ncbi:MAG: hypothetical protein EXR77_04535 [Myxococcales bacterium]|nr:hypothetical protein [Myxococcales bacterium]
MKYLSWIAFTYVLLAVLSPLLGYLDAQLFAPDVALITALYVGSRGSWVASLLCGFAVGLLKDGFSLAAPVGIYTEICALMALLAQLLRNRVDLVSPMPVMATAAATSVLSTALFLAFEAVFARTFDAYAAVVATALPLALTTMLWAPAQFALLERMGRRFDQHNRGAMLLRR